MTAETLQDFAIKYSDPIVEASMKGDERAFAKLMGIWYKRIFNFSYKYFVDHDLATEVTQKTFISVHKGLTGLKSADSFKPWLYRVALNKCHEEGRKRVKMNVFRSIDAMDEEGGADEKNYGQKQIEGHYFNPEEGIQQSEREAMILKCLNELPQEQKIVVIMKEYEGLKFREIAETLEISENTAKSRLYYGFEALRRMFKEKNLTTETI